MAVVETFELSRMEEGGFDAPASFRRSASDAVILRAGISSAFCEGPMRAHSMRSTLRETPLYLETESPRSRSRGAMEGGSR